MMRIYTDRSKKISEDQRNPRHQRSISFLVLACQVRSLKIEA